MITYEEQWQKMQMALAIGRIPQAMLFLGSLHGGLIEFTTQAIKLLLCKIKQNEPCLTCMDCQMIGRFEHPDVEWIKPERSGGIIKIDQIRGLQNTAFLTPQRTNHKLIIIESVESMNIAASNALLKILEEPAKHTIFILLAQQIGNIPPTVLSRCQMTQFSVFDELSYNNLLALGEYYTQESNSTMLLKHSESILEGLIAIIELREHPCALAAQWIQYELSAFLWFLYLVYSQIQYMHLFQVAYSGTLTKQLHKLSSLLNPVMIFAQIDKINTLLRKLSHNMNINHTLVLEDLLFSLVVDY
ncbi:TPA: DNA polymerase III subunit delta' [Legionella pneumophila]|uniref:DNA polymerase III subunit delta' n=1 Tax=Legionella pneumophila TaxID=446 RepID=UPI000D06278B|nr:DNA polymerase III subunit delta' [Legionella pneumophila]HAT1819903.1 DNA polymerase III subunit delta' [Legionella pneumophila]HAT1922371.1 DNA polymerase III subunit delta' [Legionella pneumophila]HAT7767878.1 DNA polymerase III subunit delta' [Legionella pneumophila]HAU1637803.1 DNA polymerase III subunit delta' [Legionella pneumophila]HAU1683890.1 DNA polymerase III subunit delta' [Legionella pneumophila]